MCKTNREGNRETKRDYNIIIIVLILFYYIIIIFIIYVAGRDIIFNPKKFNEPKSQFCMSNSIANWRVLIKL